LNNSLIVALAATVLAVPLGTGGAWLLYRYRFPGRRFIDALVFIPVVIPEIIMGVSLLIFFVVVFGWGNQWLARWGVEGDPLGLGYLTIIIAHVTFCFPFVLIAVRARLAGADPSLEEAAMDLGATPAKAFWLVIVPYLLPAIISGALMAFTLSLDELIVTYFTTGPNSATLPIKVFGMAKVGLDPRLNAISAIFIVSIAVMVVCAQYFRRLGRGS
jgi:spermidine/putrescine transport system permease protein